MPFSAVLLAGGKSSRFGSDKAVVKIDGVELWRRQISLLRALDPQEIFVAASEPPIWIDEQLQFVRDAMPNAGPLSGVAAALRECATSHLLVLAIDLPRMAADFLQSLVDLSSESCGVVPRRNGFFEPLAAVYPQSCRTLADRQLRAGKLMMQDFVSAALEENLLVVRNAQPDDELLFTNMNTPDDLHSIPR
jgi:molybdopterin-guanine dinucleotide biosynthesis protein A